MLDAIQRQRLERRWAFLIACAIVLVIAVLIFVAPLFLPGVEGADSKASASTFRGQEGDPSQPPVQFPGDNAMEDGTLGAQDGGRE